MTLVLHAAFHRLRGDLVRHAAAAFLCCAASLLPVPSRAALNGVTVQPTRTQVYLGEAFVLNVVVNGADLDLPVPDLSAIPADVRLLDSHSNSRHSVTIINGHVSQESVQERVFAFEVKPRAAGTLATGPVRVTYEGRSYLGQGPAVEVTGIEQQSTVIARVTASRLAVLVDEPFTITLQVAIRALPDAYAKYEPLLPNAPPHLDCAYLGQSQIAGLKNPDLIQALQAVVQQDARAPGLTINEYMSRQQNFFADPFNMGADPFQPRPIRFHLPQNVTTANGHAYCTYTFALDYTPLQEGDYTFGPVTFKGPVIASVDDQGRPQTQEIFTVGPAVTVRVVPPPETNRPDWFIGSVGRELAAHADFDATVCKVGDPLLLTLDVTGKISLGNMRPPLLNLQPDLTADFRIYDDNVETTAIDGGKRFRYRVRPVREGTLEFPPIRVAYFDTASRTYQTVRTAPIPIQARPNTQIVSDGGDAGRSSSRVLHLNVENASAMPAAITVVAAGARSEPLLPAPSVILPLVTGGPALLLLACGARALWRRRARFAVARQRGHALPHARAEMRQLARHTPDAAAAATLIRTYLAERLGVMGASLTAAEASRLLHTAGAEEDVCAACGDLLARLEQAIYRPDQASDAIAILIREAQTLLPRIDQALDHAAAFRQAREEDGP